jgi:hypothetical protein
MMALFPLVGVDEVGQLGPADDQCQTALRVGFGRYEVLSDAGTAGHAAAHRLQGRRACFGLGRFAAMPVVGVQMQRASTGGDGRTSLISDRVLGVVALPGARGHR